MGGFSEYRRKKAEMLSAAKRLRVDFVVKETLGKSARVGRGAEDGTVASDRGLPTSGWQVSVTEPVAGKPKGLSRALVAGEPIVRKNERRKARSDRRKVNGYGATEAPIDWDAADALPVHHSRSRGRSRGPDSSSGNAFPSCAALATGVALVMMVAVCALAIFAPADARAGATAAATAWARRVSSVDAESADSQSARLAFITPHSHHTHRQTQTQRTKMTSVGCELASVEEAAARVASAFARKQSIHAACEAATRFRWEGVDDDVDTAMKTLGGDDDRVVVFHAGSKFEPSAMVKAAEMMTRDDDAVTLGKGRREKGNHHHAADESGSAHEGEKEQELPLPGDGDEPPRPMTNRTTPPAPAAPPHPIHEIHRGESAPSSSKKKSSKKDSNNAGLGEGSETSNGGLFKMFSGWMRRRESAEERDFRAWLKKHQAGEVRPATAARRLLLSAEDEAESHHHSHGGSDGGWTCVIVGENAHVAEKISRAARTEGLPCASVVNRVRGGLALKGEKTDECFAKRARAIDVKLMSRARHTVATEPSDGAHVAALLRRCAREAA